MDKHLVPGDPVLVEKIVNHLKAKGIFDEFRHECLADVDTKSSCQNLSQRVDGYTTKFLASETWNPDLSKNELRNKLRRHIDESGMLAGGADHVVEQVINPKIHQLFLPKIIEVVHQYVQQETEKLKKKEEAITEFTKSGKTSTDKPKPVILDPIADILSFTYSKPKQVTQTSPSVQNKPIDTLKSEKKKEDSTPHSKSESNTKAEKKKEDTVAGKAQDIAVKAKKEESAIPQKSQTSASSIKDEGFSDSSINISPSENTDDTSQSSSAQAKAAETKVKKEVKSEESEEGQKRPKEADKKKTEESKAPKPEGTTSNSEDAASQKTNVTPSKSGSSHNKSKCETDTKKGKARIQHKSSTSSDLSKIKSKVLSKLSSEKPAKSSSSSKHSKPSKDSSPMKGATSRPSKSDKEDGNKNKSVEAQNKSAEAQNKSAEAQNKSPDSTAKKSVSLKPSSVKKESVSSKVKNLSDKQSSVKPYHSEQSVEKVKRSSVQYSSSYDSSQGSDVDKSSTSSVSTKEKQKHFSKHHKKDKNRDNSSSNLKHSKEQIPDKKRPHHGSDSGADQKPKSGKYPSKHSIEKKKQSSIQASAKIDSRSNSLGSTSSTSDSQNSSSKDNILTLSEDTSDALPKPMDKKKKPASKETERCRDVKKLPPPPPPPPASSFGIRTPSSADASSMEDTQSSQESEFGNYSSNEESSSDSEEEEVEEETDKVEVKEDSKVSIRQSLCDIFLRSSSSSEFEGFQSSPEKEPGQDKSRISDVSTSTVHTSDLSSFDDEISHTEGSDSEAEDKKVKRKLTLKEAENLLRVKAEKRRTSLKNATPESLVSEGKSSTRHSIASSEEDLSQRPEPKRESRRERKLNPKYASSEYTSIFNSKRTSFITKQSNQSDQSSPISSSEKSYDSKKAETDSKKMKEKLASSRRNLFPSSSESKDSSKPEKGNQSEIPVTPTCSFYLSEPSSVLSSDGQVISDKKPGSDGEVRNRIALKIKMSASKSDNQMNTEKMIRSIKRKYHGQTPPAKRPCNKVTTEEKVVNENEPFNNKTSSSTVVLNVDQKEFYQKQKASNNGDVLNKIEHAKNNFPNTNHVADNNSSD